MEVRFLWCSLSVLSAHTVLLLLVSLVPQLFLCCSTSIIWILSVSLKTQLYIPPWAFPTPILTFEHLFPASIYFSIIYWLVSMSPPLLMFFPRQARGLLSVQILLHAAFRTTGISCLLLHLIIWWACVPGFPLLHQTLLSSAPLLADPPTASPLSVGTLQVFILSPPPFLFIVSILTNSSSQTASVSYNIIPLIVNFLPLKYLLWCYLAISNSSDGTFLAVPGMVFSWIFVYSELYCSPCLAALRLTLISHSPLASPSAHLLNQIILFHMTLASLSMAIYLHCFDTCPPLSSSPSILLLFSKTN